MKKYLFLLIVLSQIAYAQFKPFDWLRISPGNNDLYTPVTNLADTILPLSAYTNGWVTFNGTNQFMRSRDIQHTEMIGSDSFDIEIKVSFGLPRKAMYLCGKWDGGNAGWAFIFNNAAANVVHFRFNSSNYEVDTVSTTDSTSWFIYRVKYDKAAQTLKVYKNGVLQKTYTSFTYTSSNITSPLIVGHGTATTSYADPTDGQLNPSSVYARMKMDYFYIHNYHGTVDSACIYDFNYISSQMAYDRETYLLIDATTPDGYRPGSHLCNGVNPGTDSCDAVFSRGYRKGITNVTALGYGLNKWSDAASWYINSFTNGQAYWKSKYDVFSGEINRYNVTPGVWTNNVDTANNLAAWNDSLDQWEAIGSRQAFSGTITTLHPYSDSLVAGGPFVNTGGLANADYVAMFNGTRWDSMGRGFNNSVNCFATVNGKIHAGGFFDSSGSTPIASSVAEWNYNGWTAVGTNDIGVIWSLEEFNGIEYAGTQNGLYWLNGNTWTLVSGTGYAIYCLEVYRGELWMGGIGFLAKYNPGTGTVTSMGLMEGFESHMIDFATDGQDLYAIGSYYRILLNGKNTVCNKLSRFNGIEWSAINYGPDLRPEGIHYKLNIVDKILVISGDFYVVDGVLSENAVHINLSMSLDDTSHVQISHTSLVDTAEFNFPLTVSCTASKSNGTETDSVWLIWKEGVNGSEHSVTLTAGVSSAFSGSLAPDTSTTVPGDTIFYSLNAVDMNGNITNSTQYSFIILSNPTDYRTGLIYQWWADSNTTANTSVTTWKNTIDTLTARQNTSGDRPVHVSSQINGHGVVRFVSNDYLNLPSINLTNFTIIVAFKSRNNTDNYILATSEAGVFNSLSALNYGIGGFDGTRLRAANRTGLDTNWHIATITNTQVFVDGVEKTYAASQNLTSMVFTLFGGRTDVGMYFIGDIACLRIYNSQLSTGNRVLGQNALNNKLLIY